MEINKTLRLLKYTFPGYCFYYRFQTLTNEEIDIQETDDIQKIINLFLGDNFAEANKQLKAYIGRVDRQKSNLNLADIQRDAELLSIYNVDDMNHISIKINIIPGIDDYDSYTLTEFLLSKFKAQKTSKDSKIAIYDSLELINQYIALHNTLRSTDQLDLISMPKQPQDNTIQKNIGHTFHGKSSSGPKPVESDSEKVPLIEQPDNTNCCIPSCTLF